MSRQTVTLTRRQIERIITIVALDQGIDTVTIEQTHDSGIGASHTVHYSRHYSQSWQEDITDIESW